MSELFDEHAADQAVIASLLSEINRLRSLLDMSKIIIGQDGTIYEVHQFEVLTPADVQERAAHLQEEASNLLSLLPSDSQPTDSTPDAPEAPAANGEATVPPVELTVTPADQAPAAPEAPAAPADPNAGVDTSATPTDTANNPDPAAAPATEMPAAPVAPTPGVDVQPPVLG